MAGARNRPSAAIRLLLAAMRTGLPDAIDAINTDLTAEGAPYTISTSWITDSAVDTATQGSILPSTTPQVLLETGTPSEQPASLQGHYDVSIPCTFYVYLGVKDLTITQGSTYADQSILDQAMQDLLSAMRDVVVDQRNALTSVGVYHLEQRLDHARRLYKMRGRNAVALQGRLSLVMRQRRRP